MRLTDSDNITGMSKSDAIGSTLASSIADDYREDKRFREALDATAVFSQIASLVIECRLNKGWTQRELAEIVGTSHSAISRLESGNHPVSVRTLMRVAEALGMRVRIGFEPTNERPPDLLGMRLHWASPATSSRKAQAG